MGNGKSVVVHSVLEGGPCEQAGIEAEDVLFQWDDAVICSKKQWNEKVVGFGSAVGWPSGEHDAQATSRGPSHIVVSGLGHLCRRIPICSSRIGKPHSSLHSIRTPECQGYRHAVQLSPLSKRTRSGVPCPGRCHQTGRMRPHAPSPCKAVGRRTFARLHLQ